MPPLITALEAVRIENHREHTVAESHTAAVLEALEQGQERAERALADERRQGQEVLDENRPVLLRGGQYTNDERYWQYRLRLVGLLGLAKLSDADARKELLALHARGGPADRMDVLLAFLDLGEVPEVAFTDLLSAEPKLVDQLVDAGGVAQHCLGTIRAEALRG